MTAVAPHGAAAGASLDALDAIAAQLRVQAGDHEALAHALATAARRVSGARAAATQAVLAELDAAARRAGALAAGYGELATFTAQVGASLAAADATLALVAGGAGGGGAWRRFGESGATAELTAYGSGRLHTWEGSRPRGGPVTATHSERALTPADAVGGTQIFVSGARWQQRFERGVWATRRVGFEHAYAEGRAGVGVKGAASADFGLAGGKLAARLRAEVQAGASVAARVVIGNEHIGASGGVEAFWGARGSAEAMATLSRDGVEATVGGEFVLGGALTASGRVHVGGVEAAAEASVLYGVAGAAKVSAKVTLDEVRFKADLGIAFGLGLRFNGDVSVKPATVIQGASGLVLPGLAPVVSVSSGAREAAGGAIAFASGAVGESLGVAGDALSAAGDGLNVAGDLLGAAGGAVGDAFGDAAGGAKKLVGRLL